MGRCGGGGKGLESDGKMNAAAEINTEINKRENSGGAPQLSVHMKNMGVPLLIGCKVTHISVQ